MSNPVFIMSAKIGAVWVTLAYRDGLLLANSIPSDDRETSRRMVMDALKCRSVAPSEVRDAEGKEVVAMARMVVNSPSGAGSGLRLSFEGMTDFQRRVLQWVGKIPAGKVASYKDVAVAAGSPRAYRAVGSIMANNPFPYVIPCHRVIKSDLSIGGYGTSPETKVKFLLAEGVDISRGKVTEKHRLAPGR